MVALATTTPCCWTSRGRTGVASCSLFCTCTWAMSGLVPWAKVRVIVEVPEPSLVEEMYSRWSSPFICCSMGWVTVLVTVLASAPG